jgi:leucyl aminopeptidase
VSDTKEEVVSITPVCESCFVKWLDVQPERIKNFVSANKFSAESGDVLLIPNQDGNLEKVLLGVKTPDDFFAFGVLPKSLPFGYYIIDAPEFSSEQLEHAAIGWGMGGYQFTRYKKTKAFEAKLVCKENCDINKINNFVSSIFWVRDLINTPAGDLYPEKLAQIARDLSKEFCAEFNQVSGEELRKDFPTIHAVGCGSEKKPVLIDFRFGDESAPKVVLVGKGVCFDSGGLQLKSASAMVTMKKDMAGAAHVLGLARMVMTAKLPINLRVIIPAVENLISGDSLKPGDIITTRKGITVETKNTDAEGRLILADALAFASEWNPELIIDFATLTGAARVALGPDIAALFTPDDQLAQDITVAMEKEQEAVWRLPLYQPYLELLESELADLQNISTLAGPTAGAITAALMLQQFVSPEIPWAHFDMHAYNERSNLGRPEGGEAECIRGVFKYLEEKFSNS